MAENESYNLTDSMGQWSSSSSNSSDNLSSSSNSNSSQSFDTSSNSEVLNDIVGQAIAVATIESSNSFDSELIDWTDMGYVTP